MSELQFYSVLILLAIAISTILQIIVLRGKQRIYAVIAFLFILGIILFAGLRSAETSETQIQHLSSERRLDKRISNTKNHDLFLQEFSKEFFSLGKQLEEKVPEVFESDMEQENFARKALSIREKVSLFCQKNQKLSQTLENESFQQVIHSALEHLKASAFAFYAEASSEDKTFRDFQALQKKEQLEIAQKKVHELQELLKKTTLRPQ
ncbi:MAG: hypothetical protein UHC59_07615 [Fibrobacteraceae bacterium]|jgi:hypothetical protein|nr:hypothetical protein [Fibrobacteraceae bacterium]